MVTDFQKVYEFCTRWGNMQNSNGKSASFWEYAQTFGNFDYNPMLPVIVIDESNGEYAAYANAFVEEKREFAYLEPLCTQP